jgi:multiple sugar transport system permease protein
VTAQVTLPSTLRSAPRRRRYNRDKRRSNLLTVVMWLCALYFIVPIVWLFVSSTKDNSDLFTTFGLWFGDEFNLFANIVEVFTYQDGIYARWTLNTVFYAGVSAIGASLLATMAGYAFAKYRFPGDKALFSITMGAIMIPLTALAIPTYLLFSAGGITNTPWAVILPSLVSPFSVFLMRVYAADAVPDSLIEAARVDGAGEFRIFWQVAIRLLGPGIVTVMLFTLVATWNNYFLPLIMLNSGDLLPLTDLGRGWWCAGTVLDRDHGIVRVDHPDHHRVPVSAAVLADRSRDRRREGMT